MEMVFSPFLDVLTMKWEDRRLVLDSERFFLNDVVSRFGTWWAWRVLGDCASVLNILLCLGHPDGEHQMRESKNDFLSAHSRPCTATTITRNLTEPTPASKGAAKECRKHEKLGSSNLIQGGSLSVVPGIASVSLTSLLNPNLKRDVRRLYAKNAHPHCKKQRVLRFHYLGRLLLLQVTTESRPIEVTEPRRFS